jgi:hypothetical protein
MSTRWNPTLPTGQEPEPYRKPWKKYLLPAAGVGAILLMIIIVAAILAAGGDDEDEDPEVAASDNDVTVTAEAVESTPTPEPTAEIEATPTPESEEADDAAEEDDIEIEPTPTPAPTEEVVTEEPVAQEPTPVPESQPEETIPEPELIVGDFGELPPGDMPSGSPADAIGLQFNLNMSLQNVPTQAPAFQIQRRQWSLDEVQNLASRLGVEANVVDQGGGSFRAEGAAASIYITPMMTQYVRSSGGQGGSSLPSNDHVIQTARSWLVDNGLVSANIGSGWVDHRDDAQGQASVVLKPSDPPGIISATPSARVRVHGDGSVSEATISWPGSLASSTYSLRSAEALWADASQGRGYVEIRQSDLPPNFQGATGTVTITNTRVAYTIAGSPQGTQYLVPVVVFSGNATIAGSDAAVPVSIYVQAAAAQAVPRG